MLQGATLLVLYVRWNGCCTPHSASNCSLTHKCSITTCCAEDHGAGTHPSHSSPNVMTTHTGRPPCAPQNARHGAHPPRPPLQAAVHTLQSRTSRSAHTSTHSHSLAVAGAGHHHPGCSCRAAPFMLAQRLHQTSPPQPSPQPSNRWFQGSHAHRLKQA